MRVIKSCGRGRPIYEGLLRKRREDLAQAENGPKFRDPAREKAVNPKLEWQGQEGPLSFYEAKDWNLESVWSPGE